jgi:hypothetical protein
MNKSPAEILAKYLQDLAIVEDPVAWSRWPIYISHMPDGDDAEDECVAIYDTQGTLDGRMMENGEVIEHPGIQIKIRCTELAVGWWKAKNLVEALRNIHNEVISLSTFSFTVYNVSEASPILYMGVEEGTNRRQLFTVNFLATLKEI